MAIDFPASPTTGQTFTSGTVTYTWDGTKWTAVTGSVLLDKIEEGNTSAEVIDTGSDGRFVVTTEGAEALRIDSSGRLLVGTSSNYTNYRLQIEGTDGAGSGMTIRRSQSGNAAPPILAFQKNRSGTLGGSTIVQSGDYLGQVIFRGNDGTSDIAAATIDCFVDGTPGSNDMPGRLVFSTTADGSASPTERMRIDSSGNMGVGGTPGAVDRLLLRRDGPDNVRGSVQNLDLADTRAATWDITVNNSGGSERRAYIGVQKQAGQTNAVAVIAMAPQDGNYRYFWVDDADQFRIGTNAQVGTTSGTVVGTQTSDERIKNVLGPCTYGLASVLQLDTVKYELKDEPGVAKIGFIAQQVNPVVPESVFDTGEEIPGHEGEPTRLGMEYVALIPVLVNAIKELSAEVDALKAQLQAS